MYIYKKEKNGENGRIFFLSKRKIINKNLNLKYLQRAFFLFMLRTMRK